MTASNLHFAVGAATVPLAVWAFLAFVRAPSALRLWLAGYALASAVFWSSFSPYNRRPRPDAVVRERDVL